MSKKPSTIRIGRRYRANRLEGPYDVLVVGSGIGGLTAAACLSKLGRKVCVLEQHYTAGGFTHSYDRNGYEWDVGVHYIGDMGREFTLGRRLFDYITDDRLEWAPMDDHFDRIILGDKSFDLVAGREAYRDALLEAFPDEQAAIDGWLAKCRAVKSDMRLLVLSKLLPGWLGRRALARTSADFRATTRQVLERLTSNQKLIAVLTGQWGDIGLPPADSAFAVHATVAQHYLHGGFYPVGGASRIAETIIPVIQAAGGEVFTYADVERIRVGKRGVEGVRMADEHDIDARCVISNAGVFNTFERLLAPEVSERFGYTGRLRGVRRSMASICLYIGLEETAESNATSRPSWTTRRPSCRWPTFPSRLPRIPISSAAARGGPRSRSSPLRLTPGSRPGRTPPGASAAKTTRRSRNSSRNGCWRSCTNTSPTSRAASITTSCPRRCPPTGSAATPRARSTAWTTTRSACSRTGCGRRRKSPASTWPARTCSAAGWSAR